MKLKYLNLTLLALLVCITAHAYDAVIDGIYYNFSGTNATVTYETTSYNSYSGAVVIPESVEYNGTTYSVTSIGGYAFYGCNGLTSVTIPESVTSIGSSAFSNCSGLTSIVIPAQVTTIGILAFGQCPSLTAIYVHFKNSNYSSEDGILYNTNKTSLISCPAGKSGVVTIPQTVTSISRYAFYGCSSITSITLPSSLTSIGDYAFYDCFEITSITLPSSLTSIGNSAFQSCTGITSLTLPNSLTSIGASAFSGCTGITSLTLPSSLPFIGTNAFYRIKCALTVNCNIPDVGSYLNAPFPGASFTNVTFGNNVTSIGDYAFYGCYEITSITLPSSLTSIGSYAFQSCSRLTSVTVGIARPLSINSYTFSNRTNATLYVPAGSKVLYEAANYWKEFAQIKEFIVFADPAVKVICVANWDTDGNGELTEEEAAAVTNLGTVFKNNSQITSFDELQYFTGLTEINDSAFYNASKLTSIIIPENVTRIGKCAFEGGYTNLTTVLLPNGLTCIDDYAFWECSRLKNINFPSSLQSINQGAFHNTKIESLVLPEGLLSIGNSAFNYCTALKTIYIPSTVTTIDDTAFGADEAIHSIVVADGNPYYDSRNNCNALIETATNTLLKGSDQTFIPFGIESIKAGAFYRNSKLKTISIPSSVTSIGSAAFYCESYYDYKLTTVKVDIKLPLTIDEYTFSNRTYATLYVPVGSKITYEAADYWKEFKEIIEFIEGDVNGDGETDVLDVVDIARYVVGTPAETFVSILADMNSDGQVNIGDAVTLVNEIAGDQNFVKPMMAPRKITADEESLSLTEGNSGLSLALENQRSYTAFQFDLYVPECADVTTMMLNAQRKQKHQLLYNKVENGHWRVTAFSTSNRSFQGNDGELLSFALDMESDIALRNIQFFDAEGNGYLFDDISMSGVTGLETIHNSQFTVHNSDIYDIQGRRHTKLQRGLNIVNGKKVFVK